MKPDLHKATARILLVEDNPGDARLLREALGDSAGASFDLEQVDQLSAGLERLGKGSVDLVLLDLSLPDCVGLETFAKAHAAAPDVPMIVLSGQDDESLAIQTVHEGAQDYLVKGHLDGRLLVRSIRYAMERKRAEEALAKERDLFYTLLDNLPDRIYFKDAQSRFIRISRAVAQQFKISHPREAIGKSDVDFFTAEHAQAALRDEQLVMHTGEPIIGKIEKETLPEGAVTWALTSKLPLKDKQGKIIGVFGISRDITALKKIEDELAAERNLLRNLIDNLPDHVYVKDIHGRFVVDNIAHRLFIGAKTEDAVLGKTVTDFFAPEQAAQFMSDDQVVMHLGKPLLHREEPMRDRINQVHWYATTKVPLRSSNGRIVGLVGISRDVTESKLAAEKLQQANAEQAQSKAELEKVLADLQKSHDELKSAQFQLIQAEKMQSVGRLAAGVAHEVKNPLAVLSMGIDYLTKNLAAPDPNVGVILNDMQVALKRADSIIHGLLDFSVPRELALHPEDMSALVEQSLAMVRHEMAVAPIKVVTELAPNLPPASLDRNKIIQVLVNVLTNAIHAMPKGGTLLVRTSAQQLQTGQIHRDAGSRLANRFRTGEVVVVTEVGDTGTGLTEEMLAKVFDPFFTTKPAGKGTGLGLTVTRKIVELHGGSIDIRNRPEGGAKVTMMFKV